MFRLQRKFRQLIGNRSYECEMCLQCEDLNSDGEVISSDALKLLVLRMPFLRLVEGPIEWIAQQIFYFLEGQVKDLDIRTVKLVRVCVWRNSNTCVKFSDTMKATGQQ